MQSNYQRNTYRSPQDNESSSAAGVMFFVSMLQSMESHAQLAVLDYSNWNHITHALMALPQFRYLTEEAARSTRDISLSGTFTVARHFNYRTTTLSEIARDVLTGRSVNVVDAYDRIASVFGPSMVGPSLVSMGMYQNPLMPHWNAVGPNAWRNQGVFVPPYQPYRPMADAFPGVPPGAQPLDIMGQLHKRVQDMSVVIEDILGLQVPGQAATVRDLISYRKRAEGHSYQPYPTRTPSVFTQPGSARAPKGTVAEIAIIDQYDGPCVLPLTAEEERDARREFSTLLHAGPDQSTTPTADEYREWLKTVAISATDINILGRLTRSGRMAEFIQEEFMPAAYGRCVTLVHAIRDYTADDAEAESSLNPPTGVPTPGERDAIDRLKPDAEDATGVFQGSVWSRVQDEFQDFFNKGDILILNGKTQREMTDEWLAKLHGANYPMVNRFIEAFTSGNLGTLVRLMYKDSSQFTRVYALALAITELQRAAKPKTAAPASDDRPLAVAQFEYIVRSLRQQASIGIPINYPEEVARLVNDLSIEPRLNLLRFAMHDDSDGLVLLKKGTVDYDAAHAVLMALEVYAHTNHPDLVDNLDYQ